MAAGSGPDRHACGGAWIECPSRRCGSNPDRWKRPCCVRSTAAGCRATSPSSWTATAAGPRQRGLPRIEGHRAGIAVGARDRPSAPRELGIEVLTLYAFSIENWKRPRAEVRTLMSLLKEYPRAASSRPSIEQQHPLRTIGRLARARPVGAARRSSAALDATAANRGMHVQHRAQLLAAAPRSSTPAAGIAPATPARQARSRGIDEATISRRISIPPACPTPTC